MKLYTLTQPETMIKSEITGPNSIEICVILHFDSIQGHVTCDPMCHRSISLWWIAGNPLSGSIVFRYIRIHFECHLAIYVPIGNDEQVQVIVGKWNATLTYRHSKKFVVSQHAIHIQNTATVSSRQDKYDYHEITTQSLNICGSYEISISQSYSWFKAMLWCITKCARHFLQIIFAAIWIAWF